MPRPATLVYRLSGTRRNRWALSSVAAWKRRRRVRSGLTPHLFADSNPPDVVLAELGDLGWAVGASLLVSDD
jgi:hypothetical protein